MAFLTIDGKQFEAKVAFKFDTIANKKYKGESKEYSGVETIYEDLMSKKISGLSAFWDCATAQYGKEQPSLDKIQEALGEIIENESEDDIEQLFKDAFQAMDNSGFFKLQLKEFWKNLDLIDQLAEDEKEKRQGEIAKQMYLNRRKELNP